MTVATNTAQVRIEQIRKHVTIFEVLARFGVDLPEATQQIKCPFHEDHSPSARVYADQNKVYCFTEQKSWDVIDAVATLQELPLADAMSWIEQEFGVPGVVQSLTSTIRTQLAARQPLPVKQSAELVESRLKQTRRQLGFERYTRLLMGLDLSVWEVSERRITIEQFTERMQLILQQCHQGVA